MSSIGFKNLNVFREIHIIAWHPTLVDLIQWMIVRFNKLATGNHSTLVITSGFRHDGSTHDSVPLKAIDIRSSVFDNPEDIAGEVNAHWTYDPERPTKLCCLLHAVCPNCKTSNTVPLHDNCVICGENIKARWHFHCQVHPNTQYLGG